MFAQLILARVADAAGLRKEMDRWLAELAPDAVGYEGGTAGVTDDDRFVVLALFTDAASARANSDRPEQGTWWRELEAHLAGPAAFEETEDLDVMGEGWAPRAGFVQVIRGQAADVQGMRRQSQDSAARLAELRPDLLGVVSMWHDDGRYADIAFFTSEAQAREAERQELPDDLRAAYEAMVGTAREYLDLRDPWHATPSTS